MKVKRFVAKTVPEAMERVKEELGVDAFILSTRKIRRKGILGWFSPRMVEITAAYDQAEEARSPSRPLASAATRVGLAAQTGPVANRTPSPPRPAYHLAPSSDTVEKILVTGAAENSAEARALLAATTIDVLSSPIATPARMPPPPIPVRSEADDFKPFMLQDAVTGERVPSIGGQGKKIGELENKIDTLSTTLNTLVNKMQIRGEKIGGYFPEVEGLILSLLENEVHEEFAHKIARDVNRIMEKEKNEDPDDIIEQILRQYMGDPSPIKMKRYKRTVVLLVGPTGVGKTTTLAKLAAIHSINHHAKVGIVTCDTYRIAAVEQLRTYAEILEVPISVAYSPEEVPDCLREFEDRDIVFIDTAGKSPADKTLQGEINALIKYADADEVHLVLSATTSFSGSLRILEAYGFLKDYKLLLTKLDETPTWGLPINMKFLAERPVSYVCDGQTVPDDIEVADSRKIARRLMGKESS